MMGNCNSQRRALAESLNDKCNSSGLSAAASAATKRRRKRSSSTTSSSTSSSATGAANNNQNANKPNDRVEVIDLGTDLDGPEGEHSKDSKTSSKLADDHQNSAAQKPHSNQLDDDDDDEQRQSRLERLKEGLDFIETEEDVKAVEAATLKIQSTFRGKKIRSKVTSSSSSKQPPAQATSKPEATPPNAAEQRRDSGKGVREKDNELELSSKVAQMQVQDNNGNQMDPQQQQQKSSSANSGGGGRGNSTAAPEEDEAQRAATKIQAGFKGYKTRKELEGKLPAAVAGSGGNGDDQQEGAATAQ